MEISPTKDKLKDIKDIMEVGKDTIGANPWAAPDHGADPPQDLLELVNRRLSGLGHGGITSQPPPEDPLPQFYPVSIILKKLARELSSTSPNLSSPEGEGFRPIPNETLSPA